MCSLTNTDLKPEFRARVELVVAKFREGAKRRVRGRSVMNPMRRRATSKRKP